MKKKSAMYLAFLVSGCLLFSACGDSRSGKENKGADGAENPSPIAEAPDSSMYLKIADEEADTFDPQCTSTYYTVPLNIFDRLVEVESDPENHSSQIVPSLADSWEISDDGLVYTFELHPGVTYSNGSPLTSEDVEYTFTRLLTYPEAVNQDFAIGILGAHDLHNGDTDTLEGFKVIDDEHFSITLEQPYAAFLAGLSTPGASILDKETTTEAGELFGTDPSCTIGTGPFILDEVVPSSHILLSANRNCWSGPPLSAGIRINLVEDGETLRLMFSEGQLDILDLETLGNEAEFFVHGDTYQEQLVQGMRVGINYVALNQSIAPLDNVKVRKAMQMGLNRRTILQAACSGRGEIENGIFPHGLIGFNPDLDEIPYDPEEARRLLAEAGYPDGFSLDFSMSESISSETKDLVGIIADMWSRIGINVHVYELDEDSFMTLRKGGSIACYVSSWSADFNDPDNFIYTFFGSRENSRNRSLCLEDDELIDRVYNARAIVSEEERIAEYQELEKILIQDMACWVPLFSQQHIFALNSRVEGFQVSWNGWSSNSYRNVSIKQS